jgi:HSP20 family protein
MTTQDVQHTEVAPAAGAGPNGGGKRAQLARWSPFALLDEFQDELDRLWSRPLGAPRVDVYEQNGSLVIKADVPGVKKEDLQVDLEDGDLVIKGETRTESEAKGDRYYRMERRLGRFYRRVPLPFDVRPEDVQAAMNDGVLEVPIPKPAEAKSDAKRIQVR